MRSEEAHLGARVKVVEEFRKPELRGMVGTVEQTYGDPSYRALEVRLDGGRSELFWHHELEEVEEEPPANRFWRRRRQSIVPARSLAVTCGRKAWKEGTLLAVGDRVRIRSDGGLAAARQYAGRAGRVTTIALGFDKIRSFVLVGGNREFVTHCAGGCTQDSPTETEDWSCQGKATE